MGYGRRGGGLNSSFLVGGENSANYFEENYLFEILYHYERRILEGSEEEVDSKRKFVDISFTVNAPLEV